MWSIDTIDWREDSNKEENKRKNNKQDTQFSYCIDASYRRNSKSSTRNYYLSIG